MKPSHLSQSALLLCISSLVAAPVRAQEKEPSPPPTESTAKKETPKAAATSPGEFARKKAKDARARGEEAKKAGHPLVAERLLEAAAIWDKVAGHQEKAAKLEADAAQIERKTLEIKSQARRAHSLVEQTETRRARAVARLRELGLSESNEVPPKAGEAAGPKDSKAPSQSKAGAP